MTEQVQGRAAAPTLSTTPSALDVAAILSELRKMGGQSTALFDTLVAAKNAPDAAHSIATVCAAHAFELDSTIATLMERLEGGNAARGKRPIQAAPAPHLTRAETFFAVGHEGHDLFSVAPGVPVNAALEQASCILSAALNTAIAAASSDGPGASVMWGAVYLTEMAKAAVDAATVAVANEELQVAAQDGGADHE
jgi:DUF3077 family protein